MSIEIMSMVWKSDAYTSSPAKRLLLLAIADQANDQCTCWPKIATLAKKIGCSRDYAQALIRDLKTDGYITVEARPVAGKPNLSNLYTIQVEMLKGEGVPQPPLGGATAPPRGGDHRPPESLIEPSIEPKIDEDGETLPAPTVRHIPEIITLYENNIGLVNSPMLAEKLGLWEQFPIEWVREAITAAVENNARSYAYVNTILERWGRDGFKSDSRPKKREYKSAKERDIERQRKQLEDLFNATEEDADGIVF